MPRRSTSTPPGAAFKYRYRMVVPPQIPNGPIKPKASLMMVAAAIAGLLLALFTTTLADLRSGVVLERWQLEDLLDARSDRPGGVSLEAAASAAAGSASS